MRKSRATAGVKALVEIDDLCDLFDLCDRLDPETTAHDSDAVTARSRLQQAAEGAARAAEREGRR